MIRIYNALAYLACHPLQQSCMDCGESCIRILHATSYQDMSASTVNEANRSCRHRPVHVNVNI